MWSGFEEGSEEIATTSMCPPIISKRDRRDTLTEVLTITLEVSHKELNESSGALAKEFCQIIYVLSRVCFADCIVLILQAAHCGVINEEPHEGLTLIGNVMMASQVLSKHLLIANIHFWTSKYGVPV